MAVAKSRKSPSTRGMRRSHDSLTAKQLSTDPTSGEVHLRHHVTKDGYYRGKKVIETQGAVARRRLIDVHRISAFACRDRGARPVRKTVAA